MRCSKSRFTISIIVFDELELILFVSQGLTLSTASLVSISDPISICILSSSGPGQVQVRSRSGEGQVWVRKVRVRSGSG